jgi:feruloyl esterase
VAAAVVVALSSVQTSTVADAHASRAGGSYGNCDQGIKRSFRPDRDTRVLLVKPFKAGDPVALSNTPAVPAPPTAPVDLCLVKLLIGPGHPGTPGAPSTSPGIGIEVWLPTSTNWNRIIRTYGSGGWAGGFQADTTRIGGTGAGDVFHLAAVGKGYVVSTSDHGHDGSNAFGGNGSFAMREDGGINTVLWHDFAERSMHELAVKTKALVRSFYGKQQRYAYWDGFSTGGRQGYKIAQRYPGDYDGILAGAPAINWTRFITAEMYPQTVMLRDLGGNIAQAKLNAVSAAAGAACGGATLGFLLDPLQCRYDPTKDADALCAGGTGNGGVIGTNPNAATCVNLAEAHAINKIWYGQTVNGSYPDPQLDNGTNPRLRGGQLWYGLPRDTSLGVLAGPTAFPIASDMVALELQDPTYASPAFTNATGNGMDRWRTLDYAGLAYAYARGLALQRPFSHINTDNPDLTSARDNGVKVVSYHGLSDDFIPVQGSINYFTRAAAATGGVHALQEFNRLFLIPGLAHDSTFSRAGSIDPTTGAPTNVTKVPLPQPSTGRDELFTALRNWVEHGRAPSRIDLASKDGSVTLPICWYPQQATYRGSGPVTASTSYTCR